MADLSQFVTFHSDITAGNLLVAAALMSVLIRIHRFFGQLEQKLWEHDWMFWEFAKQKGYPVATKIRDRYATYEASQSIKNARGAAAGSERRGGGEK